MTNYSKKSLIKKLQELAKNNPEQIISRDFFRGNTSVPDSAWTSKFGTFAEYKKQAGLSLTRSQSKILRDTAKEASLDAYEDFYVSEVLPFHNKYPKKDKKGRYKTIISSSDHHDIDCDEFMLSVFIDTCKRMQPDIIVLNGDVFDLYEFSRFTQDPREIKLKERFDYVKKRIFHPLRKHCPNAQIDFILGNHEWRLLNLMADKTPQVRVLLSDVMGITLNDVFGVDEFKINLISKIDMKAYKKADKEENLKENYQVYYDCFVAGHIKDLTMGMSGTSGHIHRASTEIFTNLPMGKCFWAVTGCMCNTDASYVMGRDKWSQSFLIAHIDTEKRTVSPEHVIALGDSIVVHGKRYSRGE